MHEDRMSARLDDEPESANSSDNESTHAPLMIFGSYGDVTKGLSIRNAEDDGFDLSDIFAHADAALPGMAAIADAVNQSQYALIRFPEGKTFNDLIPRKTSGWEGYKTLGTYAEDGGVGGPQAAVKQAGIPTVAVANLTLQGAAFALGLAYMSRIDSKLSDIREGIDSVLTYMEEDHLSRLKGHAITLAEYGECYRECLLDEAERTAILADTRRICDDLNGCWQKELSNIQKLEGKMEPWCGGVKEEQAWDYLKEYEKISSRMNLIYALTVAARQVLIRYRQSYSEGQIERERGIVNRMLTEHTAVVKEMRRTFRVMSKTLDVPLGEVMPSAIQMGVRVARSIGGAAAILSPFAPMVGIPAAAISVTSAAVTAKAVANGEVSSRQSKFRRSASKADDYISSVAESYNDELDRLDYIFNKANAILIGPDGIHALDVIEGAPAREAHDEETVNESD